MGTNRVSRMMNKINRIDAGEEIFPRSDAKTKRVSIEGRSKHHEETRRYLNTIDLTGTCTF